MGDEGLAHKREFFGGLDALRGIAALLVVLYHIPPWYMPLYGLSVVRHGGLMVNFFFVLSGFVLAHSYLGRIKDAPEFARFVALRFGRLYPVHLIFLLVFVGFEIAKYMAADRNVTGAVGEPFAENSLGALAECLLLVQALGFSAHANSFNFPSWSISTEFYTYLVFGAAALWIRNKYVFAGFCALVVIASLSMLVLAEKQIGEFHWILRCWSGFFLGCLLNLSYRVVKSIKIAPIWSVLMLILMIGLVMIDLHGIEEELVLPLSALLIASLLLSPGSTLNRTLTYRPLKWLGEVSYSLYMCHAAVFWVARQLCRIVLKAPETVVDGYITAQLPPALGLSMSLAVVIGSLILAGLVYRFVEKPCRELTRTWLNAKRSRPLPAPAQGAP